MILEVTDPSGRREWWILVFGWVGRDDGWVNNVSDNEITLFARTNYRGNSVSQAQVIFSKGRPVLRLSAKA